MNSQGTVNKEPASY